MKVLQALLNFAVAIFLSSCTGIFNSSDDVSSLNIHDAYYLGFTEDNGSLSKGENNLLKISTEDFSTETEEVELMDVYGGFLPGKNSIVEVLDLIPMTERYTILYGEFSFNVNGSDSYSLGLLLDNHTGAIFDMEKYFRPDYFNNYMGSRYYQTDKKGNIYYYSGGIWKIGVEDPEKITLELYMDYWIDPSGDYSDENYYISPEGDVVFNNGQMLKKASGGILNTGKLMHCFTGIKGQVFAINNDYTNLGIEQLNLSEDEPSYSVMSSLDYAFESWFRDIKYYCDTLNSFHYFFNDYLSPTNGDISAPKAIVFDERKNLVYPIDLPQTITDVHILGVEGKNLWLESYDNRLFIVDLKSSEIGANGRITFFEYSEFFIPDNYDLSSFQFNTDIGLCFEAYDLSKEEKIIGIISVEKGVQYHVLEKNQAVNLKKIK